MSGQPAAGRAPERAQEMCDQLAESIDGRHGLRSQDTTETDLGEYGIVVEADDPNDLSAWLLSDAADAAMRQLTVILGDPPGLTLDHWRPVSARPVSAVVTHRLDPKALSRFMGWQASIAGTEMVAPGFVSAEHHPPRAGIQEDWTIVLRFETNEQLQAWLSSPERQTLLAEVEGSMEDVSIHHLGSSWVGWFDQRAEQGPPSWKQAMAVLVALYPTVVVLSAHLSPRLGSDGLGWANWSAILGSVLVSTVLLNWFLIPLASKLLTTWLDPRATRRTTMYGLAATSGFVAACAAATALLW